MRSTLAALLAFLPLSALAEVDAGPTATPAPESPLMNILPLLLIFAVFYFLLIKPQQKRMKELQTTLGGLKKGDKVVTAGGIIGKITKLNDLNTLTVEIATGVEVTVVKSTITGMVGTPETIMAPAKAGKKKADKADKADKNDNAVVSRESIANDN